MESEINISQILLQNLNEFKNWVSANLLYLCNPEKSAVVQKIVQKLIYDLDNNSNDLIIEKKIEYLIESGINVNVESLDFQPLSAAISEQNIPIVCLLLKSGALVDYRNDIGETPLTTAVIFKNVDLLRLLLQYSNKETVNKIGSYFVKSPIGIAFHFANVEMIKLLLVHGANPYLLDWDNGNEPMIENIPKDCPEKIRHEIFEIIKQYI